jgi:hypothetical protein
MVYHQPGRSGGSVVLRNVFTAIAIGAMAMAWSHRSGADQYRADEFLGLDLSRAVLSPRPLGPPAGFTPALPEVNAERGIDSEQVNTPPAAALQRPARGTDVGNARAARQPPPRLLARTRLSAHHRNPLDAHALDAHVQVWPCKSGGICNWK